MPSINVSLDRPAKDLAADIARRLIPDALEYQVQAQASYDRTKNDVDKARENFDVAITRPSGGQFPISQGDRDMDRTRTGRYYGSPLYLGDRAHFDGQGMYCSRKCARRHTLDSQIAATYKETRS